MLHKGTLPGRLGPESTSAGRRRCPCSPLPWADILTLQMKPGNMDNLWLLLTDEPLSNNPVFWYQCCARKLKDLLERGRASEVDFSEYMSMSYDNPWKILNRRNDVMYKKLWAVITNINYTLYKALYFLEHQKNKWIFRNMFFLWYGTLCFKEIS